MTRSTNGSRSIEDCYRWQAAIGAIAGTAAAEAIVSGETVFGRQTLVSLTHAENMLGGAQLPIDLEPVVAFAAAVGLASQASPLLVHAGTVELIEHVRGRLDDQPWPAFADPTLAMAERGASSPCFETAVQAADSVEAAILVGGLRGLRDGIGGVPARLVSSLTDDDGHNGRRYLARLTDRLLGIRRNDWFDPRNRRGPKQVLPGLWLANLFGLGSFVRNHPDGLVLSLCDIEDRIDQHRQQITFHLEDTPTPRPNPSLQVVLGDVLGEVRQARAAGQPVLLHCRHGASRTGLILRLLLVEEQQLSAADALIEAQCLWPHTSSWNKAWNREVDRRAGG